MAACMVNLIKYVRDKTFDRVIKLTKGKLSARLNAIHERHRRSKDLPDTSVTMVEDGESWSVASEDHKSTYSVRRVEGSCNTNTCKLKCHECNIYVFTHSHAYRMYFC